MEFLEDRLTLSSDCYASLFAGPRLASVDSNQSILLEGLFNAILPGNYVDLSVTDWNAIADGSIGLGAFFAQLESDLQLSSTSEVLAADVSLAQVFSAAASVVPADGPTADLHSALLGLTSDVNVSALSSPIRLGDLIHAQFPDGSFADVDLNALNLVGSLIEFYNYENVVTTLEPVTISGTVLNQLSVNTATIYAQVIEPPVIDPIVHDGDQFYSAAIRLKLDVDLVDISLPLGLSASIGQLQIYVDVARAQGEVSFPHLTDVLQDAVVVKASHGVANVYLGSISDSLFFNRTRVVTPADLDYGNVGSLKLLGLNLELQAKAYAQGTAPFATALEFHGPYPETQTTGTSAVFVANATYDLITSLQTRTRLNGIVIEDPLSGIRNVVANAIYSPLSTLLGGVGDPLLGLLGTGVGEMDVTIYDVNCPPNVADDSATTPEDTPVQINILANDSDDHNEIDPTSVVIASPPTHGSVSVDPVTGRAKYSPALNYNGTDSFTYRVRDRRGSLSDEATVRILITPVNDAPVAVNDTYTTSEDTALTIAVPGVLGNDSDADGNALTSSLVRGPSHGTLTFKADGSFTYTPAANYNGPDSFTYKVSDGTAQSNTATVSIAVSPVNDAPVAVNNSYSTNEDTRLTVAAPGILGNDSDADGNALTAVLVAGPAQGALTLNANGSFTYTPPANYSGTVSFTYKASDGLAQSNTATVTIVVNPVNDAPIAKNDAYSTAEDTALTVAAPGVLGNDSDVDGNALTAVLVAGPAQGTLSFNANGSFTYTPPANYSGTVSFTYKASDGTAQSNTATVSITVNPVNDAPVAANDSYSTAEDTPLTIAAPGMLGNDSDVDGNALTAVLVAGPAQGALTLNANGSFTYTPPANYSGTVSFTYRASDGSAQSNTATVSIAVNPVNDAPVARNDAYSTAEDTPLTVAAPGVLGNDSDAEGSPLTAVLVAGPAQGALTLNANGSFTYTPPANYSGTVSFTYKASDGTAQSNTATVTITVSPVNDAPVAGNDSYTTSEDTTLTVAAPGVLGNDSDVDGNALTAVLVAGPAQGTLSFSANGSFTYTPPANYSGTVSFTYRASDGTAQSNTATVTITVSPVNDAPVARNDAYSTPANTPLTVAAPGVLGNDSDADGNALTAVLVAGPAQGTLSFSANGSFTYTPPANYSGTVSFTYKASDGSAQSNTATVSLTIRANTAPVARDDSYTVNEDTALTVAAPGLLGNDSDAEGSPLTAVLVAGPAQGTLSFNSNGSFTYTPPANYSGTVSFTYRASDGSAQSNTATVSIAVNPVNDAPIARNDAYSISEDKTLTVAAPGVLGNDSDADGNALTAVLVAGPAQGTLTFNSNGSFTYTPPANYSGTVSFTYKASDGTAQSNTATVTIAVNPVNDAPVAANDSYSTAEDTPLTIAAPGVLGNDSDVDGNALTAVLVAGPAQGALTLNANGSFTYTPPANYSGTVSFTYKASDGSAQSNTATVTIVVNPVSDAPIAKNDAYSISEDKTLTVAAPGVLGNDNDPDGNALTAVLVAGPAQGALTFNSNGSFTYTPPANYSGTVSFTYKASDGTAQSNTATVSIAVNPVNDAPVAANDSYSTAEDTPLTIAAPGVLGNDSDVDGNALTAVLVAGPAQGTLTFNSNGSFTYTPPANYSGTVSFTYRASDGKAQSNTATVSIAVNPVSDTPVAANDSYTTKEDTVLTVAASGILGNDSDGDGDALTAALVSGPSHGTLTLNANGSFTYTPTANYNGPDSFTYRASDGTLSSNTATVSITVVPVNDAPVAVDDCYYTSQNTQVTIAAPGVRENDSDVDSPSVTSALVSGPSHGTLIFNSNGSFTYTPASNFTGADSFTYRNNDGSADSNVATVILSVAPAVADLSLNVGVDNTTPNAGGEVNFTIVVTNAGPDATTNVSVVFPLPSGLQFEDSEGQGCCYSPSTGIWSIGSLASGASATLHITATAMSLSSSTLTAEVLSSDARDPDSIPNNRVAGEDDQASVIITPMLATSRVVHTSTTARDYANGVGDDLSEAQYIDRNGTINSVAPGVFFYYSEVRATGSSFTIRIDQSINHPNFTTKFGIQSVRLYNLDGTESQLGSVTIQNGNVTINVSGATANQLFIVQVKYDTSTVVGKTTPNQTTIEYWFATNVNNTLISQDKLLLKKK